VALDEESTLVLRGCSIPAAWMAERELVVCYELSDFYYVLSAEQHRDTIESLLSQWAFGANIRSTNETSAKGDFAGRSR
jgi:hypothetical protein